jgi:hypothetical protein
MKPQSGIEVLLNMKKEFPQAGFLSLLLKKKSPAC